MKLRLSTTLARRIVLVLLYFGALSSFVGAVLGVAITAAQSAVTRSAATQSAGTRSAVGSRR